jgi:hypothetical protein
LVISILQKFEATFMLAPQFSIVLKFTGLVFSTASFYV